MTQENIAAALRKYKSEIPKGNLSLFKNYLEEASDDCMEELMAIPLKNKLATKLFSIFLGRFGVDRFYVGDIALGVIKSVLTVNEVALMLILGLDFLSIALTAFAWGWYFMDIFNTYKATEQINYDILVGFLAAHKAQ